MTDDEKKLIIRLEQLDAFKTQLESVYYQKPGSGIPKTDLASAVQTSLGLADTALQSSDLNTLNGKVAALEALISEDPEATTHAIDKFNEIVAFLAGITDTQTLDGIISGINNSIAAKYTKPTTGIPASDLAEAVQTSLGKADTALQSADIADMALKSEMSVVAGTGADADKTTITLKTGTAATVLTQHQDISGKVDVVAGKGLSTNDYTDADKAKVDYLSYASNADIVALFASE